MERKPRSCVMSSLLFAAGGRQLENQLAVLVVEDDHLVQSVVEECLTDGGFETVIASSGDHAVELLDASEGKYMPARSCYANAHPAAHGKT
jgi:hypothetical protein